MSTLMSSRWRISALIMVSTPLISVQWRTIVAFSSVVRMVQGKTHLLRALYLAVVGEAGVGDLKKVEPASEATRFVFERSLNRRAQAEGKDTVRLQVKISQHGETGGGSRKAVLVREIRHRPNSSPVWRSYADGRTDGSGRIEEEKAPSQTTRYTPPSTFGSVFLFRRGARSKFQLRDNRKSSKVLAVY